MLNRVPIRRLPNRHTDQRSRRIARACDECRARKSKCDGKRPVCSLCASAGRESCVYSESKRIQERRELESANQEVDRYDRLLREISQEVDLPLAKKIMKALRPSPRGQVPQERASSPSSASSASSVGSLDALDTLDEDVNQSKDSRATGYLGKSSEAAWLQSLEKELRDRLGDEGDFENHRKFQPMMAAPMASMNNHIESADYPSLEDDNIYSLPAKAPAERLLRLYLDSVQPSLPIIREALFTDQFNSLYSGESIHPGRKWLAVLNLVFAISSKLCQISGQDIQSRDHQFFSRAQKLNISESLVEDHEDLQQVQMETLAAFYLLTSSQINRAWKMIGTATRSSIALGLHLRATHNKLNASALEARHKLWWSIFILENLLSVMTGRASGLGNSLFSAPPPLASKGMECFTSNAPEARLERPSENPPMKWTIHQQREQLEAQQASMRSMDATNELYFFCLADLVMISHTASAHVYNTDAVRQGWSHIQSRIGFYNKTMEGWCSNLPDSLRFEVVSAGPILSIGDAYRVSLAMHYYSSRIILNRPCLTRPKNAKSGNKKYLSRSRKETEMICLHSALAILSIFPNQPDPVWACYAPWWNVLHFLVQATAILIINISFDCSPSRKPRSQSFTSDSSTDQLLEESEVANSEAIRTAVKKALHWLYCLGETDGSARWAFELCNSCIRRIVPNGFDLDEFASMNTASKVPYPDVPTDPTYQQHRSKLDVPYSQFVGTRNFGYDRSTGVDALLSDLGATDGFDVAEQPCFGTLGPEIDMSNYIVDPECATLNEMLKSLAGPDNKAI